jgi:leucyl aminopeptidase
MHHVDLLELVQLATLIGAIDVALGSGAAAVFTSSPPLWDKLHMVHSFSSVNSLL